MQAIKAVIIGPGNIGTDLMIKALRSKNIDPVWMVGIEAASDGLARAKAAGLRTTHLGIDGLLDEIKKLRQAGDHSADVQIAFDATSAYVHAENNRKLQAENITVIDLTPAAIGPFCIPPVNLQQQLEQAETNVNMVTCGGQATIPIVAAISQVQEVEYAEIIATIASKSAGPGTRKNIDEFTRTTSRAIEQVGGAKQGKAIIVLNPAEPPLLMRDTVHVLTKNKPDQAAITASVEAMVAKVKAYVPGYRLKNKLVFDDNRVSIFLEVEGLGDYLPKYAGNLDIMTSAALHTAEMIAVRLSGQQLDHIQ